MKKLLFYDLLFSTPLMYCMNNELRLITIEGKYKSESIVVSNDDQAKVDFFYHHNFVYQEPNLCLPEGIARPNDMLPLLVIQRKKISKLAIEYKKLKEEAEKKYKNTSHSTSLAETIADALLTATSSLIWNLTHKEVAQKIALIPELEAKLSKIEEMENLIVFGDAHPTIEN